MGLLQTEPMNNAPSVLRIARQGIIGVLDRFGNPGDESYQFRVIICNMHVYKYICVDVLMNMLSLSRKSVWSHRSTCTARSRVVSFHGQQIKKSCLH